MLLKKSIYNPLKNIFYVLDNLEKPNISTIQIIKDELSLAGIEFNTDNEEEFNKVLDLVLAAYKEYKGYNGN